MAMRDPAERPAGPAPADEAAAYRDPEPFAIEAAGHALTVYPSGADRFDALLALIGTARESLRIAFYIFACDASGRRVRDALSAAARRGVAVSVIVDGFGAEADETFFAPFVEAGGRFGRFIARWSRRYLIRNHQKIVLADARVAMLGGFNVEDSYFAPPGANGWSDLGMRIEGPIVERIGDWFDELEDWVSRPDAQLRAIRAKVREWQPGEGSVRLLIGGPIRGLSSWAACVRKDLETGTRLDMAMAYFSPSPGLIRRIQAIARRGQARLLMAGKSDNGATIAASRAFYKGLLRARARVFEFEACKLHTKLIVLDDTVYFGSGNFDMRSLFINLEIMVRIEDAGLAARMRDLIYAHMPGSREVTPSLLRQWSGPLTRLRWWACWFLVTVVDYTVSRRLNLGF